MDKFNNIGIDNKLDWDRIERLMKIGIFAACMVFVGDVLIGYGMHDSSKAGMECRRFALLHGVVLFYHDCIEIFLNMVLNY